MMVLIDDVFWMLPVNSNKQAKRVRQDFSITEEVWNARREVIRADHRAETARTELEQSWKRRLISKGGGASAVPAATAAVAVADGGLTNSERELGRLGLPARTGPEARLLGAGDQPAIRKRFLPPSRRRLSGG